MELLYIYIDRYREFRNQEIVVSSRFNISYRNGKLSIEENENYVDIYPSHIKGVSGIFGKNASGKSSLLELIGSPISERHEAYEIFDDVNENRLYSNMNLEEILEEKNLENSRLNFQCEYFLIYYVGKKDGRNTFIFEGLNINKWKSIFKNSLEVDNSKRTDFCYYYFNEELIVENVHHDIIKNMRTVYFKNNTREHCSDSHALKRVKVELENDSKYEQLSFLLGKTGNIKSKLLSGNHSYELNIKYKNCFLNIDYMKSKNKNIYIKDYTEFDINHLDIHERLIISLLSNYTCSLKESIDVKNRTYNFKNLEKVEGYDKIKDYYLNCINQFFIHEYARQKFDIDNFKKGVIALESVLKDFEKFEVEVKYKSNDSFSIIFNENSKIEENVFKNLFNYLLDEFNMSNRKQEVSYMDRFLKLNIVNLSEGERANVALFTAIDYQIGNNINESNIILLFDEIEKNMHPELARNLVDTLIKFLSEYQEKSFQIILASHSPFIASDIVEDNTVYLFRDENSLKVVKREITSFAQNIHTLLKEKFFLEHTYGEYSIKHIKFLQKKILELDLKSSKINEIIGEINEKFGISIKDDEELLEYFQININKIGEPLLKNELQRLLDKNRTQEFKRQKIKWYEEQIRRLKQGLEEDRIDD